MEHVRETSVGLRSALKPDIQKSFRKEYEHVEIFYLRVLRGLLMSTPIRMRASDLFVV